MKIDANALIDILKQEKTTYNELLNLAKQEQQLILDGDTDGLTDIIKAIERRLSTVHELENKRNILVHPQYADDAAQTAPALSSLIREFDTETADQAETLKNEILKLLVEFGEINYTNGELVKRGLSYVNFMLNTLIPEDNPTYGDQQSSRQVSPRIFDGRA